MNNLQEVDKETVERWTCGLQFPLGTTDLMYAKCHKYNYVHIT